MHAKPYGRRLTKAAALNATKPEMFAKVFSQIFDSSIAENYETRHVFMDLLVLADSDGVVDMTPSAIARRTNVPLEHIERALVQLTTPDSQSRTPSEEGRRLLPIDHGRPWGWQIVNFHHYRSIRDEEARREYWRDYKRKERESKRPKAKKKPLNGHAPVGTRIAPAEENHPRSFDQFRANEINNESSTKKGDQDESRVLAL